MATHYKELHVWQSAIELVDHVYDLVNHFPKLEKYSLSSQLRRAVVSVPSNIAEGAARNSTKEFLRFIAIAKWSLAEVDTQLLIAIRRSYISQQESKMAIELLNKTGRMLSGLQKSLRAKQTTNHQSQVTNYA